MLTITHADSCNCRNDGACDITLYYLPGSRLPEGVKHGTYYWGNTIRVEVRDPDGSDCTDQDRPGICVIFVDSGVGPSYYKALRALLGGSLYNMLIPEWKEDGKGVPYPIVAATSFGPNMSKEGGQDFGAEGFRYITDRVWPRLTSATLEAMKALPS